MERCVHVKKGGIRHGKGIRGITGGQKANAATLARIQGREETDLVRRLSRRGRE